MQVRPIVYSCVTRGYDAVKPVPADWDCDFVLFHDGTVEVPSGWQGRHIGVHGLHGIDLNRYAKMLPHHLLPDHELSLYVDGNINLKQDPRSRIESLLATDSFCAYSHPTRNCAYQEIREALRLGFVGPHRAWRQRRVFASMSLPRESGLFEAGILFRRHHKPAIVELDERWWSLWQGGLRRDQPILAAAAQNSSVPVRSLGPSDFHSNASPWFGIEPHRQARTRLKRLPQRLAAELTLYRWWLR